MQENGNSSPISRAMVRAFRFLVPTIPSGNYHPVEIPWTGTGQPRPPVSGSGVPLARNNSDAPSQNGSSK